MSGHGVAASRNMGASGMWFDDRSQGGAKGIGSRRCVWEFVPKVIETLAELSSAGVGKTVSRV